MILGYNMYFDRLKTLYTKNKYHVLPIKSGMVLELHENVGEGDTKRVQKFKGLVIEVKKPKSADGMFTIRGQVAGMTVEKIYPLSFPKFEKVILLDMYRIRQSRIFFMRDKVGKGAKLKSIISTEDKDKDLLQVALSALPVEEVAKEDTTQATPAEDTTPVATQETTEEAVVAQAPVTQEEDTPAANEEAAKEVVEEKNDETASEEKKEA